MERITVLFLLLFCSSALTGQDSQLQADRLLQTAIENQSCVGLAAGFAVDGEVHWVAGAGYSNSAERTPFSTQTLNHVGAIGMTMTAVAIMQLYEEGLLELDAPIRRYLPDLPRRREGSITVRHLLTQSSGVPGQLGTRGPAVHTSFVNLIDAVDQFQDRPLQFKPGTSFRLSNNGYMLLGRIIEEVAGMPYDEYLRYHVWDPAGMDQTALAYYAEGQPGVAAIYEHRKDGTAGFIPSTESLPGGGVYSTTRDLLKFGNALLDGTLLQSSTLALMLKDSGLKDGAYGYGLGWYLYGDKNQYGPMVGHSGGPAGPSVLFILLPEQETTVVVLSNTAGAMQTVFSTALQLFEPAAAVRE